MYSDDGSDDEPPPLVASSSDDEPPPLVASSSDEDQVPNAADSEDDNDVDFPDFFRLLAERASKGPGWHHAIQAQALPALPALALPDSAEHAAQCRREEEQRQARLEREAKERRCREQLERLSEAYRAAWANRQQVDEAKKEDRMALLLACVEEAKRVAASARIASDILEGDAKTSARSTSYLAAALQAESLTACVKHSPHLPSAREQARRSLELLKALPGEQLPRGLQSRMRQLLSCAHVGLGSALLAYGCEDEARAEAVKARDEWSSVDLGGLSLLFEKAQTTRAQENVAECNWGCGLLLTGLKKKQRDHHRNNECKLRPVKCSLCHNSNIAAQDLKRHKREDCPARLQPCNDCGELVPLEELDEHKANHCEARIVPCSQHHCDWQGPLRNLKGHEARCPWMKVACEFCFEEMEEWRMQMHVCPLADGSEPCICCVQPLGQKLVAMLLMSTEHKVRRVCNHFHMCTECAVKCQFMPKQPRSKDRKKEVDTSNVGQCPYCRAEYNMVCPLAEHLVVPPEEPGLPEPLEAIPKPAPPSPKAAPKATPERKPKPKPPEAPEPVRKATPEPKSQLPKATQAPAELKKSKESKAQSVPATPKQPAQPAQRVPPPPPPKPPAPPTQRLPRPKEPKLSLPKELKPQPATTTYKDVLRQPTEAWPAVAPKGSAAARQPSLPAAPRTPASPSQGAAAPRQPPLPAAPSTPASSSQARAASRQPAVASQARHDWAPVWGQQLEARRPPVPVRAPQKHRYYDPFRLSPLDIHFAHDSVKERFRPFVDSRGKLHDHTSILDTALEIAKKEVPKEMEVLDVVWLEEQGWTVAGTFNRRLVVFRLLAIFFPQRFRNIKVVWVPVEEVKWEYQGRHKLSTQCKGVYIEVRWHKFVGKGLCPAGEDLVGVRWPEAQHQLAALQQKGAAGGG